MERTYESFQEKAPRIHPLIGKPISLLNPQPEDINLDYVAHILSRTLRFNGDTTTPFSVADHSILVADIVQLMHPNATPQELLAASLHDAHEAYLGDIIQPVKDALAHAGSGAHDYQSMCTAFDRAIYQSVGLTWPPVQSTVEKIAEADHQALLLEDRILRNGDFGKGQELVNIRVLPCLTSAERFSAHLRNLINRCAKERTAEVIQFTTVRHR